MKICWLLLLAVSANAEEHHHAAAPPNPVFEKLKTLVGKWDGSGEDSGKKFAATTSYRMTSGNSVLMNTLGEGTPHEMITMIFPADQELLATHYCAAQNQPQLKVKPGPNPNQVIFEFSGGTNIQPGEGHMQRLVVTLLDADHHTQDWVYLDKGKERHRPFRLSSRAN